MKSSLIPMLSPTVSAQWQRGGQTPLLSSKWLDQHPTAATLFVMIAAAGLAIMGACDHVGGWNDCSRLAMVECLGDYHTLVIDQSIFAQPRLAESALSADGPVLGTGDKLFINGHFYSDKSPVPGVLMAGWYQVWKGITGETARSWPSGFIFWMTVGSSGSAYLVAVSCVFGLGRPLALRMADRLWLTSSFGVATAAATYSRQVNNHILLLGVAAALVLCLVCLTQKVAAGEKVGGLLLGSGLLAGLGYSIDLGAGPVLLVATMALIVWQCRTPQAVLLAGLGALPWVVLHHALNFIVGGTLRPANAVAEYFNYPGSAFHADNMTGALNHASVGEFMLYAGSLLGGKRGFLGHNLPLWLALPAFAGLVRRRPAEWPAIVFAVFWSAGTWLLYALSSTHSGGLCCTVRWFIPLLAPGYLVLALCLRDYPHYRSYFLIFSFWGAVQGGLMWYRGPWEGRMVPGFWLIQAAALFHWILFRWWRTRRRSPAPERPREEAPEVFTATVYVSLDDAQVKPDALIGVGVPVASGPRRSRSLR